MGTDRPGYLRDSDPFPEAWRPIFRQLVKRLVLQDYAGLNDDGFLEPVHADNPTQFGHWIEEYPDDLVELPENPWPYSSYQPSDQPGPYHAQIELWTRTQAPSNLTLEAIVRVDKSGEPSVKLYDAHVM